MMILFSGVKTHTHVDIFHTSPVILIAQTFNCFFSVSVGLIFFVS